MARSLPVIALALGLAGALGCEEETNLIGPGTAKYTRTETHSFAAGGLTSLRAATFTGAVLVRPSSADSVHVVVTRWAEEEADLDAMQVTLTPVGDRVEVVAENPSSTHRVGVDLEVTVPEEADLDLASAVGSVRAEGRPHGTWTLGVGVGSIEIVLPADVSTTVSLEAAVGGIELAFPVSGQVTANRVTGTIGGGAEGQVTARTAVGSVSVLRR